MDVGERMTPHNLFSDEVRGEFAFTMARYRFCVPYCTDQTVLDSGCGVGNGSLMLSAVATHVTAIDNDPAAIQFAETYYKNTDLDFLIHDGLTTLNQRFDVIVSLDVIEHTVDPGMYLTTLLDELAKKGILIISTPNKLALKKNYLEPNRFHKHEMTLKEFTTALKKNFEIQKILGQDLDNGTTTFGPATDESRGFIAVLTKK